MSTSIQYPVYVGIFFNKTSRNKIEKTYNVKLDTNSHITLKYLGNKLDIPPDLNILLGSKITVKIKSISTTSAGKAFVVEHKAPFYGKISHITIIVNKNYRPVDVGDGINETNTTPLKHITIKGVILTYAQYLSLDKSNLSLDKSNLSLDKSNLGKIKKNSKKNSKKNRASKKSYQIKPITATIKLTMKHYSKPKK